MLHYASFAASSALRLFALKGYRPDVVFVVLPTIFTLPVALLRAKIGGAKVWVHIHDFEIDAAASTHLSSASVNGDSSDRGGLFRLLKTTGERLESFLLKRCHAVSTISESMIEKAVGKGRRSAAHIFDVELGG